MDLHGVNTVKNVMYERIICTVYVQQRERRRKQEREKERESMCECSDCRSIVTSVDHISYLSVFVKRALPKRSFATELLSFTQRHTSWGARWQQLINQSNVLMLK